MIGSADAADIRRALADGVTTKELTRRYHVSKQYISLIKCNQVLPGFGPDVKDIKPHHYIRSTAIKRQLEIASDLRAGYSSRQIVERRGARRSYVYYVAAKFGLLVSPGTTPIHGMKLTWEKAQAIRAERKAGKKARQIAVERDLHLTSIYKILSGRIWKSPFRKPYHKGKRHADAGSAH